MRSCNFNGGSVASDLRPSKERDIYNYIRGKRSLIFRWQSRALWAALYLVKFQHPFLWVTKPCTSKHIQTQAVISSCRKAYAKPGCVSKMRVSNLSILVYPKQQWSRVSILVHKGSCGSRGWRSLPASTHLLSRPRC